LADAVALIRAEAVADRDRRVAARVARRQVAQRVENREDLRDVARLRRRHALHAALGGGHLLRGVLDQRAVVEVAERPGREQAHGERRAARARAYGEPAALALLFLVAAAQARLHEDHVMEQAVDEKA